MYPLTFRVKETERKGGGNRKKQCVKYTGPYLDSYVNAVEILALINTISKYFISLLNGLKFNKQSLNSEVKK